MKYRLIFFSGTGNTELISRELATRLQKLGHAVELASLGPGTDAGHLVGDVDVLGFGFPVYKFTFPDYFRRLFPVLNRACRTLPYFVYATYARFSANCFADFARHLDPSQYKPVAARHFKCPENGIASRRGADEYEYRSVMYFEDGISGKLDSFAREIIAGVERHTNEGFSLSFPRSILGPLQLGIVHDIERTKYPKLRIDHDRCNGCGLCAKDCPDTNITMETGKAEAIDAFGCLHCLRCMHHCHQNAIAFGALTDGDNRYTKTVRDELFKNAASGVVSSYWKYFKSINARWRMKTITYWLKHRNSPEM